MSTALAKKNNQAEAKQSCEMKITAPKLQKKRFSLIFQLHQVDVSNVLQPEVDDSSTRLDRTVDTSKTQDPRLKIPDK